MFGTLSDCRNLLGLASATGGVSYSLFRRPVSGGYPSLAIWTVVGSVEPDFRRLGQPMDNAFIEAFNGRFSQECLNDNWFLSLEDAEEKVETWRSHYNGESPHRAPGNLSPREFTTLAKTGD